MNEHCNEHSFLIECTEGEETVQIKKDKYGTELRLTLNGGHWTEVRVTSSLLELAREAIEVYSHSLVIGEKQVDQEISLSG